jgi:aminocarboxymuconate-semialdehyde decarboxylase
MAAARTATTITRGYKEEPELAIDMHAHWTPRGLIQQSAAGRDWYGWKILKDQKGREHVAIGERILQFAASSAALDDPARRARLRREGEGIDLEALLLTGTFWNYHLDETESARFTREVNTEVAEVQRAYPDRFQGVAVLPMQHPKVALRELDHATGHLGLRTIFVASNVRGLNLDEPAVLPVLEAAAALGVSIIVHPTIWEKAGEDRMPRYHFWNSFGAPLESSLAAMSIVYSGLLDRHPNARFMFTQGGGWIHFGVGRLNLRYLQREDARPMAHPPVEYLARLYFDCLVHDYDSLELIKKRAGAEHIFIGTDYPAGGNIVGGAVPWIEKCRFLNEEEKQKVLWRNAAGFLRLEPDCAFMKSRTAVAS